MQVRLQPLDDRHNRGAFSCGIPSIDNFLHKVARQRQNKGLGTTIVAIDAIGDQTCITGFVSVILHEFRGDELLDPWRRSMKIGNLQTISGALLAQLGVNIPYQGQGIGKLLVRAVFERAMNLVDTGCAAIAADPLDEMAERLYAGFDFRPLGDGSKRMIVPMKTVIAAVQKT